MDFCKYFGAVNAKQFLALGARGRSMGVHAAYSLLDVGTHPTAEQIRMFEDVCFTLRLSNGTFRTSFRNRFADVNAAVSDILAGHFAAGAPLVIQDRAVSHALTSMEWAIDLLARFSNAKFEASDLMLYLVELRIAGGTTYIAEPDGTALQAIRPPFVVSLCHPEGKRYPLHRWVASRERRRFEGLHLPAGWTEGIPNSGAVVRKLSMIHPEARALAAHDTRFEVRQRSVFEVTPAACDVLRTMNILNRGYFSTEHLMAGIRAVWSSVRPGGLWIVGRTMEHDFSNHATILKRTERGWNALEQVCDGSEMETLALEWSPDK